MISREQVRHVLNTDQETGNVVGERPTHMTASEIMRTHQPLDNDREVLHFDGDQLLEKPRWETDQEVWSRKGKAAKDYGLTEDIAKQGVLSPVQLGVTASVHRESGGRRPEVLGGHHRIAAMAELDPHRPIPVTFHGTGEDARSDFSEALKADPEATREEPQPHKGPSVTTASLPPPPPERHLV